MNFVTNHLTNHPTTSALSSEYYAVFNAFDKNSVRIRSLNGNEEKATDMLQSQVNHIHISANGDRFAYSQDQTIHVCGIRDEFGYRESFGNIVSFALSPDGSKLLVSVYHNNRYILMHVNVDDKSEFTYTECGNPRKLAWRLNGGFVTGGEKICSYKVDISKPYATFASGNVTALSVNNGAIAWYDDSAKQLCINNGIEDPTQVKTDPIYKMSLSNDNKIAFIQHRKSIGLWVPGEQPISTSFDNVFLLAIAWEDDKIIYLQKIRDNFFKLTRYQVLEISLQEEEMTEETKDMDLSELRF